MSSDSTYTKNLEELIKTQGDIFETFGKILDLQDLRIAHLEEDIKQLRSEIEYEKKIRTNDAK